MRCPTINPPEKAPARRITPVKIPKMILVVLFTMPPIVLQQYYDVIKEC
jgi:hypothetical protein